MKLTIDPHDNGQLSLGRITNGRSRNIQVEEQAVFAALTCAWERNAVDIFHTI